MFNPQWEDCLGMTSERSRFTSDRREPEGASWASERDWSMGTAEDVDIVNDDLVPSFLDTVGGGSGSDLTQYSRTDPDGHISIVDAQTCEVRLPDGSNDFAHLFASKSLSDYSPVSISFSFEMLRYNYWAHLPMMVWADTEDSSYSGTDTLAGIDIGTNGTSVPSVNLLTKRITDTSSTRVNRRRIASLDLNTVYDVQMVFDVSADQLSVDVSESGAEIGSGTIGIPTAVYDWLYVVQAKDGGFNTQGNIDADISNFSLEKL